MYKIIISVHSSEIELFRKTAVICECFIYSEIKAKNGKIHVALESHYIMSFYELGFQFGAYSPLFISN